MRTGLGALVYIGETKVAYDMWAFTRPFHWSIWLAMGSTLGFTPLLVYAIECLCRVGERPFAPATSACMPGLAGARS